MHCLIASTVLALAWLTVPSCGECIYSRDSEGAHIADNSSESENEKRKRKSYVCFVHVRKILVYSNEYPENRCLQVMRNNYNYRMSAILF